MKKIAGYFGTALFFALSLSGCRQTGSANIVMPETKENVGMPASVSPASPRVDVVTAEPATKEETNAETQSQTAEDKPGAVAVKVAY